MLSRRDLITAGVAGSVYPAGASVPPPLTVEQPDREGHAEIARRIGDVHDVLQTEFQTSTVVFGAVARLRSDMEQFLRTRTKFPDYIDVGVGVFLEVYDWHVKNQQQLTVSRTSEGRYTILFMFSTLILRPEQDRNYISPAYDRGQM